jgi:hypothetical protein
MGGDAMTQPEKTFDQALSSYYNHPDPSPEFISQLEGRLLSEGAVLTRKRTNSPFHRARWMVAMAALLLTLAGIVGFAGPGRVWAAVRGLLGFVPGIGIVPVNTDAVVLAEPVESIRDGVTVRVEQLLSTDQTTTLVFTIDGIPQDEKPHMAYLELEPGNNYYSHDTSTGNAMPLCDPDCDKIWRYRIVEQFWSLPKGVTHVTMVWKRYTPNQLDVTEEWRIPLTLVPMTADLRAKIFPPAYSPDQSTALLRDFSLKVSDVTQDSTTTVVKTQLTWRGDYAQMMLDGEPKLSDDLGNTYSQLSVGGQMSDQGQQGESTPSPDGSTSTSMQWTLVYGPINPAARRLTLRSDAIWFRAYFMANIPVDLGPNPAIGSTYPLDKTVQFAGHDLHLAGMRLVEQPWGNETLPVLQFKADPLPAKSGIQLHFLYFSGGDNKVGGELPSDGYINGAILTPEQRQTGKLTLFGDSVEGTIQGPWEVSWDIPKNP